VTVINKLKMLFGMGMVSWNGSNIINCDYFFVPAEFSLFALGSSYKKYHTNDKHSLTK
jgi:hypothetical protein